MLLGQNSSNAILVIALSFLAFLGNYFKFPIFFGVDFIFGSIAAMLAIRLLGTTAAAFIAFIGAIYTFFIWAHPYAIIIFTVEAIVVGYAYRKYSRNLVISDLVFWLSLGIPLVLIFYVMSIGMSFESAIFIAVKQAINGLFNALVAGVILITIQLKFGHKLDRKLKQISLNQFMFHTLLTIMILSGGLPIIMDSRAQRTEKEGLLADYIKKESKYFVEKLENLEISDLNNQVLASLSHPEMDLAVINHDGHILANRGNIESLDKKTGFHQALDHGLSIWLSTDDIPTMRLWKQGQYFLVFPITISNEKMNLIVERAAQPLVLELEKNSIKPFSYLSLLFLLGILFARIISSWISRSITELDTLSTEITNKIIHNDELFIPRYAIKEYDSLGNSLKEMSGDLRKNVSKLKSTMESLQEARVQAETATQAKSQFLANMSHELRTPMHAIMSFADLSLKRVNDEKLERFIKNIKSSGIRLTNLLNDLLDLSKLEAGKMDINFTNQNLTILIREVIEELSSLLLDKNISVNMDGDKLFEAEVDKKLFTQVILNLLSNSIKYSPDSSVINISLEKSTIKLDNIDREAIHLSVFDEGVGIPENQLQSIFDQFIQSSETKSNAGGTGLGLPISKQIIQLHNGQIWAESSNESNKTGASFHVLIPVGKDR